MKMSRYIGVFFFFFIAFYSSVNETVMASVYQKSASRLHSIIAEESTAKRRPNFIFSPHSILSVAATANQGAAGQTRAQLDNIVSSTIPMYIPDSSKDSSHYTEEVTIDIANRIYVSDMLSGNDVFKDYKKKAAEVSESDVEVADFTNGVEAAAKINKYVSDTTRGHISDLVRPSSITQDTSLVLVNALYFKARWAEQFSKEATFKGKFKAFVDWHVQQKTVKFMTHTFEKSPVMYFEDESVKALAVPYVRRGLFMYIIMPKDIFTFEMGMGEDPKMVDNIIGKVRASVESHGEEELTLSLPKFKLNAKDNDLDLERTFVHLGAKDMFYPGIANFSGINGDRDLYVSSFLHQADISVDEEGTEATAATMMGIATMSMPMPKSPLRVVIDSPFVYQVRYSETISWGVYGEAENDIILFSGRISDPSSAQ